MTATITTIKPKICYLQTIWIDDKTCLTFGFDVDGHVIFERPATEVEQRRTRHQKGGFNL